MKLALTFAILSLGVAAAQETVENKDAKPTPEKKARMLLDSAAEMVAATRAEVQAGALMHLGDNFDQFDKKRALELFRQSFTATASIDDAHNKVHLQAHIAGMTSRLNIGEAIAMLKMMPVPGPDDKEDYRHEALAQITQRLVEARDFDQPVALIEMVAENGPFPLGVLNFLLGNLPTGDYRCGVIFSKAVTSFTSKPQTAFGDIIWRHWRRVPPQAVESAVKAMADWIVERKDADDGFRTTVSAEKGTASFNSRKDYDLFSLMRVIREFDPKRADELLMQRPALRAMIDQFPDGVASIGHNLSINGRSGSQLDGIASSRAAAARVALNDDPQKALDLVSSIPLPESQAEVLGEIASSLGEANPEKARSILTRGAKLLTDVKEPQDRIYPWLNMATAAHRIKDDTAARDYLQHAMDDVVALYKRDTDEDHGNYAIREEWPSTQTGRRVIATAAKLYSVDAEPLLTKINDPEIALLARIELARVLQGRGPSQGGTSFRSRSK